MLYAEGCCTLNGDKYISSRFFFLTYFLFCSPNICSKRKYKLVFLHDTAPSHMAKPFRNPLKALNWEVLSHAAYSSDLTPSDYVKHVRDIDGSPTYWAELWFVRRCEKMTWWMIRRKRGRFVLPLCLQISRQMEKIFNKRWSILWIRHYLSFFRIERVFS